MSLTHSNTKAYTVAAEPLYAAALTAVTNLEGKLEKQDADAGIIAVKFHKTIHGKVLGDRTRFELAIRPNADGSELDIVGYPLDAVGQPLKFGARKGVTQTVLNWIHAHIDHNLKKADASN